MFNSPETARKQLDHTKPTLAATDYEVFELALIVERPELVDHYSGLLFGGTEVGREQLRTR